MSIFGNRVDKISTTTEVCPQWQCSAEPPLFHQWWWGLSNDLLQFPPHLIKLYPPLNLLNLVMQFCWKQSPHSCHTHWHPFALRYRIQIHTIGWLPHFKRSTFVLTSPLECFLSDRRDLCIVNGPAGHLYAVISQYSYSQDGFVIPFWLLPLQIIANMIDQEISVLHQDCYSGSSCSFTVQIGWYLKIKQETVYFLMAKWLATRSWLYQSPAGWQHEVADPNYANIKWCIIRSDWLSVTSWSSWLVQLHHT